MSISAKQLTVCGIVALGGLILYFGNNPGATEHRAVSEVTTDSGRPDTDPSTFAGYECTEDCSGHKAGYEWAKEHDISDGDACDTAGDNSNSPSFAEGCHAYVDGNSDSEDTDNSDDEN